MRIFMLFLCFIGWMPAYADQWILSSTTPAFTDTLNVGFSVDKQQVGDLYLAVQIPNDSTLYFVSPSLQLQSALTPFKQNEFLNNSYTLFSLPVRILPSGTYLLFALSVNVGENPYNTSQWIGTLQQAAISVLPPSNDINLDYLCIPPEKWHAEMSHCMIM